MPSNDADCGDMLQNWEIITLKIEIVTIVTLLGLAPE